MSNVSFIEKLLKGVEVEWKPLENIVITITAPSKVKREAYRVTGKIPIIDQGINFIAGYTDENVKPVNLGKYIVFGDHSEHIKYVDFSFIQGADGLKILKPKLDNVKYIYYAFQNFYHKEFSYKRHWSTAKETLIPIPPLDVQNKIVQILDNFTELTTKIKAELTAEFTARKKQYNYYRDQLLTFEEGKVEWKTLGEVGVFTYGYAAKAQDYGSARFVRISDINSNGKLIENDAKYVDISKDNEKYILQKNDLLMARTGATYGKTMFFEENYPAIYAGFLIKLIFDKNILNPKYYWHFAQSDLFWNQAKQLVSGGGQPQFNANVLKLVNIAIPSLSEQDRIVAILDKFDSLTNSISEGLPREIKLRQQQYEYYRDLLLSFPPPLTPPVEGENQ